MLSISLALALTLAQPAQAKPEAPAPAAASPAAAPSPLPPGWLGEWKGEMTTATPSGTSGPAARFTMELRVKEITPGERWTWTIIYDGPPGRSERPYELIAKDAAKGAFQIDEKNGIVLDATLLGDTLASPFQVQGTTLLAEYRLREDAIEVAIWSWRGEPVATGPEGLPVKSWRVGSVQRGVLKKSPS